MFLVPFGSIPFPLVLEISVPGRLSQCGKSVVETEGRTLHGLAARLGSFPGGCRPGPGWEAVTWVPAGCRPLPQRSFELLPRPWLPLPQDSFTLSGTAPSLGATSLPPQHSLPRSLPGTGFLFPHPSCHVPAGRSCGCSLERQGRGRPRESPQGCPSSPAPDVLVSGPHGCTALLLEHFLNLGEIHPGHLKKRPPKAEGKSLSSRGILVAPLSSLIQICLQPDFLLGACPSEGEP